MTHAVRDAVVVAVVVTYHPDLPALRQQLETLLAQVGHVVVVDNHSDTDLTAWLQESKLASVEVLVLERNFGIGTAQNRGIECARARDATHVLLMDQDSLPAPDMVAGLLKVLQARPDAAAAGPYYKDARRQQEVSPFVRLQGARIGRVQRQPGQDVAQVDCLISSGCLIPMPVLQATGPMREDLFIDYVDTEWCLRAARSGYRCYGVFSALMTHSLGESPVRLMGRLLPMHSPLRHYYQMRNALLIYREGWVPLRWRVADSWQRVLKLIFYWLVSPPRLQHLRMMLLGAWHGLRGRAGPL